MAELFDKGKLMRLEDYIVLAKEGKDVHAEIKLRKQPVKQKVHPEETEDMKSEIEMYLLIGDYTFRVKDEVQNITKVYLFGCLEESRYASEIDRNIANERLKVDYRRLREANITFEEKYF